MTRVLIVDDHEIVRQGLRALLASESDLVVVGEAATGAQAIAAVRQLMPDVVLLDLRLPDMSGVEVCKAIAHNYPSVAVIALSTYEDDDLVTRCIRAGVRGYIVKDVRQFELKESIRSVARGEAAIDPKVGARLLERLRRLPEEHDVEAPLSEQQRTILRLVSEGYRNREIAARLNLSENTVKGYVQDILQRLGVRNRIEAVMMASRRGWI